MIGKVTALLKTKRWFKRGCLRYRGGDARYREGVSISKSAVDFERVFEAEKRLKKNGFTAN